MVEGDELWLIIDRDRWNPTTISEIAQKCTQSDYYFLGLSNPCFEIWLLLHLEDISTLSSGKKDELLENKKSGKHKTKLKKILTEKLGSYNPSNIDCDQFLPKIPFAIESAKKLDLNPKERWINGIGTRVYLLVEKLV